MIDRTWIERRPTPTTRPAAGRHPGRIRLIGCLLIAAGTLLAGCTLGPSQRPALATFGTPQATTGPAATSTPPLGAGGPGQQADPIQWTACSKVDASDPASGLTFQVDCAELLVDPKTINSFGDQ